MGKGRGFPGPFPVKALLKNACESGLTPTERPPHAPPPAAYPASPLMTIWRFMPSLPWGELMLGALALMLLTGL